MTSLDLQCLVCGCVNKGLPLKSRCQGCNTVLEKPFIDPQGEALFGVNLKLVPMGRMVSAIVGGKSNVSKMMSIPFAVWSVFMRRISRGDWVRPKFKGSALRYVALSLDRSPGVDKNALKIVTQELGKSGFIKVLDRLCETYYPGAYQRIFTNESKRMYAVASFSSAMGKSDLQVITLLPGKKGMISVSDALPDFIEETEGKQMLIFGADARTMINTLAKEAPLKKRRAEGFGLQTLLRELGESHNRLFNKSVKEKKLVQINEQSIVSHTAKISGASECAMHAGVIAIRRCALCGKPLCGQCHVNFEGREYCSVCLPDGADRSGDPPLDFSGDYTPAGFLVRGSIRVAELSIFFWLAWVLFPAKTSLASIIIYQALAIAGFIAYFQTSVALWGATPMQKMAGLSIVDAYGERLSVTSTIVRAGYLLLTLIMIVPVLGYLPAVWDKYKRGWHDRMSGTLVVTSYAPLKEKLGAIVLGLMLSFGIYNYLPIYNLTLKVLYSTLQNLTPPGNLSLKSVWSKRTRRNSAILDGKRIIMVDNGRVTAFDKPGGTAIWNSPTSEIDMVFGSSDAKYYYAVEQMGDATRIYAIDKKDGKEVWQREVPGKLASTLQVSRDGVRLIAGRFVTAINNKGEVVWNQEPDYTPVAIYTAGQNIVVETREGEARKTYAYRQKGGEEIITLDGLSPATKVGEKKYLLTGEGGTSLIDLATGQIIWSIAKRLSIVDSSIKSGQILHSVKSARRMSDGMKAFGYPAGCEYTGSFKKVAALYCAKEGRLNIINASTGVSLAVMESDPIFRTLFLGEDEGGYILLTLKRIKKRLINADLFLLKYDSLTVTVFNVGHFREEPHMEYIKGKGLFIVSPSVVGLYKAPWRVNP